MSSMPIHIPMYFCFGASGLKPAEASLDATLGENGVVSYLRELFRPKEAHELRRNRIFFLSDRQCFSGK